MRLDSVFGCACAFTTSHLSMQPIRNKQAKKLVSLLDCHLSHKIHKGMCLTKLIILNFISGKWPLVQCRRKGTFLELIMHNIVILKKKKLVGCT